MHKRRVMKKYFRGSRKHTKKCAMKMKQRNKEKNDAHVKILLMEGGPL